MRAIVQPLLQVFLGIVVKRLMGLNREGLHALFPMVDHTAVD